MTRPRLYPDQLLINIVDKFCTETKVFGQIEFANLAEYARKEYKLNDIRYYHFSRPKTVRKYIEEINNSFSTFEPKANITVVDFNPDRVMELYWKNNAMFIKSYGSLPIDIENSMRIL